MGRENSPTHDPFEVDDLPAIEHAELDGETRLRRQAVEVGERRVTQLVPLQGQPAEFEQAHADPVSVAVVVFQPADGPELFGQAVHGRFRQVGPLAQVGQAEHLIAHVERIEDRGDAAEHGSPSIARVLAA